MAQKGLRSALFLAGIGLVLAGGTLRVSSATPAERIAPSHVRTMDLSSFSDDKPARPLRLLFIHHSCGGQLLADPGPDAERANCIYTSHPNGGGLRRMLSTAGYEVHEASYGSEIGAHTDLFDWLPKFRDRMTDVLSVDENDRRLADGVHNEIVMFKSCFTQSEYVGEGTAPGDPHGPALTVWNAKATLTALKDLFRQRPDVLFVYVTAPPLAPRLEGERLWHVVARTVLGKPSPEAQLVQKAAWAREVNDWVKSENGWLAGYPGTNVAIFDYYDELTDEGRSNLSRYATGAGLDSHPSSEGNARAAAALVPLLNRAVRRAGLTR